MTTDGFDTLFARTYLRACRFACGLVGATDAEDATQEAYIRLYRVRHKLAGVQAPEAYFYRILYNVCLTMLKRKKIWRTLTVFFRPDHAPGRPDEAAELAGAWSTFSPSEKAIFILMDYQNWEADVVATVLGMAPATLRVHRHRLRQKIEKWEAR